MRIKLSGDAVSGAVQLPANEYWVSLHSEAGEMCLSAGGKDIRIKATRRKANVKTKTTQVQFYSGGGRTWSLVISTPKHGEWVAFLDYTK